MIQILSLLRTTKIQFTILSVLTAMLILVIVYVFVLRSLTECSELVPTPSESETKNVSRLVSRDEWLAKPPVEPLDKLQLPVHRVIIAHTATSNCSSQASCSYKIQNIQNYHMNGRHFNDIIYNFLVGGDGSVYEGRGWDVQGAHTKGFNVDSICIAFIGTFSTLKPPEKQLNAVKWIINEGVRFNKLVEDYRLYGARQFVATESPGSALYEIIKNWPNWSDNTSI